MFHKHKWKEIARTYAPSSTELGLALTKVSGGALSLIHGQTTILWECEECQEREKEEMLGKEVQVR